MDRESTDWTMVGLAVTLVMVAGILGAALVSVNRISIDSLSTVLLTLLTSLYVFFTYGVLKESTRQRKQDILPAFAISIENDRVLVKNVGNGPALDTELTLSLEPKPEDGEWKTETSDLDVPAGESIPFVQEPFRNFGSELSAGMYEGSKLRLEGNYLDVYDNRREIRTRTYDLSPYRNKDFYSPAKNQYV